MKKILWVLSFLSLGVLISKSAFAESKCQGFKESLCVQVYAPVWCVSLSVGGAALKKPIYSKASNACVAMNQIRKKACDKGFDWKSLEDEEVHCVLVNY